MITGRNTFGGWAAGAELHLEFRHVGSEEVHPWT
jgi:hypothetical protein